WLMPVAATRSPTELGARSNTSSSCRREGSTTASKALIMAGSNPPHICSSRHMSPMVSVPPSATRTDIETIYAVRRRPMKYLMQIYQGEALEVWGRLSEEEQQAIAADYQALNQTPGVTPGEWL